jgi:putative spermidine/putrescine transport system ATP-binding protein
MTPRRGDLRLEQISQRYGDFVALDRVALNVSPGEFVTLLGPSGSGKTTTLRIIAGFSQPDEGRVLLDGKDVTVVPPHRREIGMVFQHYALFPHMSVADNIAFPLKMRNEPRDSVRSKVEGALDIVRMSGLGNRRPRELSGGQQQRIALARALVFRPPLLLMDEPLGALDRKLREEMQVEIVRIGREEGITIIYVTHDQEEALAMSDRIAVYRGGKIEQVGSPKEIYERPASRFVANFIGESTTLPGHLVARDGHPFMQGSSFCVPVDLALCQRARLRTGSEAVLVVRPEAMQIAPPTLSQSTTSRDRAELKGRLQSSSYLGSTRRYVVDLPDRAVATVRSPIECADEHRLNIGCEVTVSWPVEGGIVLPAENSIDAQTLSEAPAEHEPR